MANTDNMLRDHVISIRDKIEAGWTEEEERENGEAMSGFDYLQDALDIQYIVNGKREYLGARVLVAFGGPNIWINTQTKTVEGYWWGDSFSATYQSDAFDLDDCLETLWSC